MALRHVCADNPDVADMNTNTQNIKQRHLKRQLASHSYTVDPEQVAVAIIVKLAQGGLVGPGGPTRGVNAPFRLRQAA
jgi:hypothetical protein